MKPLLILTGAALLALTAFAANNTANFSSGVSYATNNSLVGFDYSASRTFGTSNFADVVSTVGTIETAVNLAGTSANNLLRLELITTNAWAAVRFGPTNGVYFTKLDVTNTVAFLPADSTNLFQVALTNSVTTRVTSIPAR